MRIEIKNPNIVVKASNPSIVIRISGVPTVPGNPIPTADNDFIIGNSLGIWLKKTLAQVKTILGLGSAAYTASGDYAAANHNHVVADITDFPSLGSISSYDIWIGTEAAYTALGVWDTNTIYYTT